MIPIDLLGPLDGQTAPTDQGFVEVLEVSGIDPEGFAAGMKEAAEAGNDVDERSRLACQIRVSEEIARSWMACGVLMPARQY